MQNVNEFTGGYQNGSLEYRRSQLHDPATLYELQQQQLQQQQQQATSAAVSNNNSSSSGNIRSSSSKSISNTITTSIAELQ